MHSRLALAAFAVLMGMSSAARADIYAAGPAYGANPTNGVATCRVINVGVTGVNIPLRQIITNTNAALAVNFDNCNVGLGPGQNCEYRAPVPGNFALSCRLFVTGNDPQISGTLDVQNPFGTVRVVVPLQNTNN